MSAPRYPALTLCEGPVPGGALVTAGEGPYADLALPVASFARREDAELFVSAYYAQPPAAAAASAAEAEHQVSPWREASGPWQIGGYVEWGAGGFKGMHVRRIDGLYAILEIEPRCGGGFILAWGDQAEWCCPYEEDPERDTYEACERDLWVELLKGDSIDH